MWYNTIPMITIEEMDIIFIYNLAFVIQEMLKRFPFMYRWKEGEGNHLT